MRADCQCNSVELVNQMLDLCEAIRCCKARAKALGNTNAVLYVETVENAYLHGRGEPDAVLQELLRYAKENLS